MIEKQVMALLGGAEVLGRKVTSRLSLADAIAKGLPRRALDRVKKALRLTDAEIASALGISQKTISRLRTGPESSLGPGASDRLYRLAVILSLAAEVLEEEELAREWLRTPQVGLNNRIPLDLLNTEAGAREVEDLLGRIENGVLS